MSTYYLLGSDTKIKNINSLQMGFQLIPNIKEIIKNVDLNKKYYYISDPITIDLGYNITSIDNFYNDANKTMFLNFIQFIRSNTAEECELYKFWSIFDKPKDDINDIYDQVVYNLSNMQFPDDKFEFDFHTKYILYKDKS